ncbi:MAG: CYTH and CHAD domain-containing protein [Alphaproteobacteria bacterium]|nr:CYTH and CHAD domain-containing protein [Alphaproteobacteria bacterium]
MSEREIELKLTLEGRAAARLRRDALLQRRKMARARNERLIAVYFDTADLDLKRAGAALRVRQEGRRRVQTLKAAVGPAGGLQTRVEVTAPIRGTTPDLALIDDPAAAESVRAAIGDKALTAVFSTDVKRTLWLVEAGGSLIEVALDVGEIRSVGCGAPDAGGVRPILEAELELKRGEPTALLDFARELRARIPFRIGGESKAARGYALFLGREPAPKKAEEPAFEPEMSVRAALAQILRLGVAQVLANDSVIRAGADPEGVHQARVAVRRMRAALSAFRPVIEEGPRKRLAKPLRWMQQQTNPARDWDVFLDETLAPVLAERPEHPGLKALAKRAGKKRKRGYKRAVAALDRKRFQHLLLDLESWGDTANPAAEALPVGSFAHDLLAARYKVVLDDAGADPTALETEALHELRIEIKKLRYAVEFFRSLYPKKRVGPFLQATKKLQDCLGGLNDAAVAHRLLQELADGAEDPAQVLNPEAVALVEGHQARKIEAGLANLAESWARFRALPVYWETGAVATEDAKDAIIQAPSGARSG